MDISISINNNYVCVNDVYYYDESTNFFDINEFKNKILKFKKLKICCNNINSLSSSIVNNISNMPITHLNITKLFNQRIDNLPSTIKYLTLGSNFDQPIDNLPSNLIYLTLGYHFNQPIDNLPSTIKYLTLKHKFNQPINNLPSNLTHLTLGHDFNQPINSLPSSITHLTLGFNFNQPIDSLPSSITRLELGYTFNQPINSLPPKLTYLSLDIMGVQSRSFNYDDLVAILPESLKRIKIPCNIVGKRLSELIKLKNKNIHIE